MNRNRIRTLDELSALINEAAKDVLEGQLDSASDKYDLVLREVSGLQSYSSAALRIATNARHARANIERDRNKLRGLYGAISDYMRVYDAYRQMEDSDGFGTAALHLGATFEMQGQLAMAGGFYNIARSALGESQSRKREYARTILRLSTVHLKAGEIGSGRLLINQAKNYAELAGSDSDMSLVFQKEAIQYLGEGSADAALLSLEKARNLIPPRGYGLVAVQYAITRAFVLSSDPALHDEALQSLDEGERLATKNLFGHQLERAGRLREKLERPLGQSNAKIFLPNSDRRFEEAPLFSSAESLRSLTERRYATYLHQVRTSQHESDALDQLAKSLPYKEHKALVMKGGGAKGLAYVGAISTLQKHFEFTSYVGTSAGAIAAVLLASGYSVSELEELLREKDLGDFLDGGLWRLRPNRAAHSGLKLANWIEEMVKKKLDMLRTPTMADLPIRATVVATSLKDKSAVFFDSKEQNKDVAVGFAVRASAAIPIVFDAVEFNGDKLVDGGLVSNFGYSEIRRREPSRSVLGLYLKQQERANPSSLYGYVMGSMRASLSQNEINTVDENPMEIAIIDPSPVRTMTVPLERRAQDLLIQAGRVGALELLTRRGIVLDDHELSKARSDLAQLRESIKDDGPFKRAWRKLTG